MIETSYRLHCPVLTALLSDFHNSDPYPILKLLEAKKPGIITVTGDFIFGNEPDKSGLNVRPDSRICTFLRGCAGIAPTFVSLGNHEWPLTEGDLETVSSCGTVLLDNAWTEYGDILIGGLTSAYVTEYRRIREAFPEKGLYPVRVQELHRMKVFPDLEWLDEFERQPGYKILLCHHPEYFPLYLRGRAFDLIFAGHAHGGHWRYYSLLKREWRGVYAPWQGLFPSLTAGVTDGRLVISCGLSNPTFIPRINNPTEIVYIN